HAPGLEDVDGLVDGTVAAAERDDGGLGAGGRLYDRARHQLLARRPFLQQPIEHQLVFGGVLGVGAELRVPGAAGEVGGLRMYARERAVGDAVAVLVDEAVELLELEDLLLAQHLAAVRAVAVVPL